MDIVSPFEHVEKQCFVKFQNMVREHVKTILTKYIDDPFTSDPECAPKEEFERRHINAIVYDTKLNTETCTMDFVFYGVVQGETLICPDGSRIENFHGEDI